MTLPRRRCTNLTMIICVHVESRIYLQVYVLTTFVLFWREVEHLRVLKILADYICIHSNSECKYRTERLYCVHTGCYILTSKLNFGILRVFLKNNTYSVIIYDSHIVCTFVIQFTIPDIVYHEFVLLQTSRLVKIKKKHLLLTRRNANNVGKYTSILERYFLYTFFKQFINSQ